ncbi:tetratricopeptide repeat protein [Actinomadura sp. 3N508]|uniref:tetratricopeptide repeat protein n=1 Tax=Actinomadura sp. 3N508 TaxID=3375153 RepID=UPI0037AE0E2B
MRRGGRFEAWVRDVSSGEGGEPWAEAAELNNRGLSLAREGRYSEAITVYLRAVDISRAAGHRKALATALDNLSSVLAWSGRIEEGIAAHEEALAIFVELGDVDGQCAALSNLAAIHVKSGWPGLAVATARRAVEVGRLAGDRSAEALATSHLGQILAVASPGDLARSIKAHRDALAIWREVADRKAEAATLETLAQRLAESGQYSAARATLEQALVVLTDLGHLEDAAALKQFLESFPAGKTGAPGHAIPPVPGVISMFGCLSQLASIGVGAFVIWKNWGTWWWVVAGVVLVVYGLVPKRPQFTSFGTSGTLGVSTPLDPGGDGRQEERPTMTRAYTGAGHF